MTISVYLNSFFAGVRAHASVWWMVLFAMTLGGCQGQPSLPLRLEAERGEAIGETLIYLHNESDQTIGELSFKRVESRSPAMVMAIRVGPGQVAQCGISRSSENNQIIVTAEGYAPTTFSVPAVPEQDIDTSNYDFAELPKFSFDP